MWRAILIFMQLTATVLFLWNFDQDQNSHPLSWIVPILLIFLVVINSVRFTRLVSWGIFSISFFSFLVLLSAFTLRWRLEAGFESWPFYRAMIMYIAFVYVSLGQIKMAQKKLSA